MKYCTTKPQKCYLPHDDEIMFTEKSADYNTIVGFKEYQIYRK